MNVPKTFAAVVLAAITMMIVTSTFAPSPAFARSRRHHIVRIHHHLPCAVSAAHMHPGTVIHGKVSYYDTPQLDARGKQFRPKKKTVAMRCVPLGSWVRIKADNGRSVIVKVTDRGPYVRGRIADASLGTAKALHKVPEGVFPARIEIVWIPGDTHIDDGRG